MRRKIFDSSPTLSAFSKFYSRYLSKRIFFLRDVGYFNQLKTKPTKSISLLILTSASILYSISKKSVYSEGIESKREENFETLRNNIRTSLPEQWLPKIKNYEAEWILNAARAKDTSTLKTLNDNGITLNYKNTTGATALHLAAMSNDIVAMYVLINCNKNLLTETDGSGQTPLHYAIKYNNIAAMKLMLSFSPSLISMQDNYGRNAFHIAAKESSAETLEALKQKNDENYQTFSDRQKKTTSNWRFPFPKAEASGQNPFPELTLEENEKIRPLEGEEKLVRPTEDIINTKDHNKETALHESIRAKDFVKVAAMINSNNINSIGNHNITPIIIAAAVGEYDIVKLLVDANVTLNDRTNGGLTALMAASVAKDRRIFDLLISKGAYYLNEKNRLVQAELSQADALKENLSKFVYNNFYLIREIVRKAETDKHIILSIDGGGIRGLFPALILKSLEDDLRSIHALQTNDQKKLPNLFSQVCDLMSGTSTGGLISLALSAPKDKSGTEPLFSIDEIAELYSLDNAKKIFHKNTSGECSLQEKMFVGSILFASCLLSSFSPALGISGAVAVILFIAEKGLSRYAAQQNLLTKYSRKGLDELLERTFQIPCHDTCEIILVPDISQNWIQLLRIRSDTAYVRYKDQLFYVDKFANSSTEIKVNIKEFDLKMKVDQLIINEPRGLLPEELIEIKAITRHNPGKSLMLKNSLTEVLIPAWDITDTFKAIINKQRGKIKLFKQDDPISFSQAAGATSAAPTIFDIFELKNHGPSRFYIDGGVFANNPTLIAVQHLLNRGVSLKDIYVISIGTGMLHAFSPKVSQNILDKLSKHNDGLGGWITPFISIMTESEKVHQQTEELFLNHPDHYFRIQLSLSEDMELDDLAAIQFIEHQIQNRKISEFKPQYDRTLNFLSQAIAQNPSLNAYNKFRFMPQAAKFQTVNDPQFVDRFAAGKSI